MPLLLDQESTSKKNRTYKGKSILEDLSSYIVIDLETTGLDPRWDSIIEVAAIKVEKGDVNSQFQSLVNPGYEIPDFITELTGITNNMLTDAPMLDRVLPDFIGFIGKNIVVGHNVNFDINFIYDSCLEHEMSPFSNDFVDTMRLSRRMFKEERHHRLRDLVKRFGISDRIEHRALADSIQTYKCYEFMKSFALENNISFKSLYPKPSYSKHWAAKDITATNFDFDESSPVYKKSFVFTGALERMVRKDAMQLVVNMGGICLDNVTKKTNFLVLGNNDYCTTIKGGKSAKQKKAEQLKLQGYDIDIISENLFYELIDSEKGVAK